MTGDARGGAADPQRVRADRGGPGERVDAALERLVERGVLGREQAGPVAAAVAEALAEQAPPAGRVARWGEIVSYAGGTLVLAGGAVLVAASWQDMSRGGRVGLLGIITLLLLCTAIWAAWGPRAALAVAGRRPPLMGPVRRRVAAVTWTLGAGTGALGAGEIQDAHQLLVASSVGLFIALIGYAAVPGPLGLLAVGLTAVLALHEVLAVRGQPPGLLVAMATIALGGVFAALGTARALPHRVLALGIGAVIALIGAQWPLPDHPAWAYGLTFLVGLGCLAVYALERTWVLIVAGVVGITVAVPEAIWDWTGGALSGGLMTVLTGFVLLAAGGLGLAWHRRTGDPEAERPSGPEAGRPPAPGDDSAKPRDRGPQ